MITATNIRKQARESLEGKWGKGILISFCYFVIQYMISLIDTILQDMGIISYIFSIMQFIISVPLTYGLTISFMKLKRGEDVKAFDFLSLGFSAFERAWKVTWRTFVKLIFPIILMIIAMSILISIIIINIMVVSDINVGIITLCTILFFAVSVFYYVKSLYCRRQTHEF